MAKIARVWDGSEWVILSPATINPYPSQTGNGGKVLQTDGAVVSWQDTAFTWDSVNSQWTSEENINLSSGLSINFGGTAVLSATNYIGNAATVTNGVYTTETYTNPSWISSIEWSKITSTPTTLSNYGITSVPWSVISDTPTTLFSYGMTDPVAVKSELSLELVENIGISTWAGTNSITTVGNISTGTWSASVISASYIDSDIARLASPTFTGIVTLPSTTSIGNVSSDELSRLSGLSANIQEQLDLKSPIASPTFTGSVTLPSTTSVGVVSSDELSRLSGVSANIQDQLDLKAELASPTFTGNVSLPSTTTIGTISSDELSRLSGVSANIQTQLDLKATLASPTFTGTVTLPSTTSIGDISSTEISYLDGVTSSIQTQLNSKAPLDSPTFTGTVSGITKTMVGLSNVDNTSDTDKPVSTAQQTALDLKANLSGATFTGFITLHADPTQAMHAATKEYVDNAISGIDWHQSVNLFADSNVSLTGTTGTLVVDGHSALDASDNNMYRILLTAQSTDSENGIYLYTDNGSTYTLVRTSDADSYEELIGSAMFILEGTTYGGTSWIQTSHYLTSFAGQSWTQFSGSGTVTAGTNISVNGLQISTVNNPTFSGLITASSGVAFSDGTQTKQGVPSISSFVSKTASYTLDDLSLRDNIIEVDSASATTVTIPPDSSLNFPTGASLDVIQIGSGEVTIAAGAGVTINSTPGLKLRTQWSSCTLLKRSANTWIVYGDLKA